MSDIRDHRGNWPGTGVDMGDTIMHTCLCGSDMWRLIVSFDDFEIASYSTDMECVECETRAKAPTPIDKPGYKPDSLAF